jgi:polyphosphate kinase 2 (PPK2 family)
MKIKIGGVVDLKAFMERAAAKKKQTETHTENQCNQLVIFEGNDDSGRGTSVTVGEGQGFMQSRNFL